MFQGLGTTRIKQLDILENNCRCRVLILMTEIFQYDVFISHSFKDKLAVRELAERLKVDGLRVWLAEWEIQPGDGIANKINQGLAQSRTLVLVTSANIAELEWVTFERQIAQFTEPTDPQRRFILLRLDGAKIKETLKQFAYVDWRHKSAEDYARLLAVCYPPIPEEPSIEQQGEPQPDKVLRGHTEYVGAVAVTADGLCVVSGSGDNTVRVWDVKSGRCLHILKGHTASVNGVAVTPNGRRAVSSSDDKTVRVWDVKTGKCLTVLKGHHGRVYGVAVKADGRLAISGSDDSTVRVWDVKAGKYLATLEGHTGPVFGVAIMPNGQRAISGSGDKDMTVRVWDVQTRKCLGTLEGQTSPVNGVAVTADGGLASSGSDDDTVRVWDLETGKPLATFKGHTGPVNGVAVTLDGRHTISGSVDKTVRVWELTPFDQKAPRESDATHYTNAKVLLVGDTGVGKTGLAYRLTGRGFVPTISTDGVWATQLKLPDDTGSGKVEKEIWLWDFAGQADYSLIHQLFMDETALAVLVFNPQSENPFEGLGQWDRDLQGAARRPFRKLLVAGRCDRGGLMVSHASIERFRKERNFAHFLETSAYNGKGCAALRDAIISNISWNDIPWTTSPRIFKLLKDEIVSLKDEGKVLLRMGELKQQLEMRLPAETFTIEQLRAVVALLVGPGIVWQLEFGDFVLLQPERINSYAAAVVRKIRAHTEEIAVILEEDVLAGRLDYQGMKRLPHDEEQIVLRAMHQTFVGHELCLREPTEAGTLLVFPSYFKRERPDLEGHPAVFVTYKFNGRLDRIYATLVVRLHHTLALATDQLWRYAADFRTQAGKRVGIKMIKQGEGAAEIAVYFEPNVTDDMKVTFIRYVHEHLQTKAQDVIRLRHYVCPHCGTPVENRKIALERLNEGKKDIICVKCEQRIPLWDLIEEKFASEEFQQRVRKLEEEASKSIDNESKELILVGHAFALAGEAGQIFRPTPNSDWGIDGEIEFKNDKGEASGKRVYLQLKSGDSYLHTRKADNKKVFDIKKRHAEYWKAQAYPVMLVIRTSDGQIRWMNVTDYLNQHETKTKQIIFEGEPFTALNIIRLKDRLFR